MSLGSTYAWKAQSTNGTTDAPWTGTQMYAATNVAPPSPAIVTAADFLASPSSYSQTDTQSASTFSPSNDWSTGMADDFSTSPPASIPASTAEAAIAVPAFSTSHYVRYETNWTGYLKDFKNYGYFAPKATSFKVFLDFGAVCSSTGLTVFSSNCVDTDTISARATRWIEGYTKNYNHLIYSGGPYVIALVIGSNNSQTNTSTTLQNNASHMYDSLADPDLLYGYANTVNDAFHSLLPEGWMSRSGRIATRYCHG
jgi:hypothetical protein